ncbi:hypothetical protein D3Z48_16480 [Clostridiaceae bacterium]|nr:hypothetical protein [Clostridiaceae bacterium]
MKNAKVAVLPANGTGASTQRRENLRGDFLAFFSYIFATYHDFPYKVLLARGCSTLFEAQKENRFDIPPGSLMTDSGLLARAGDLVTHLKQHGKFPSIVLIDDIMVYGRAMNAVLLGLERQISALLPGEGLSYNEREIRHKLSIAVRIEVFAYHGDALLLYPEYQRCRSQAGWSRGQRPMREFRRLTLDMSSVTACSDVANASYTISARLPKKRPQADAQLSRLASYLANAGYSREVHHGMTVFQKYSPDPQRASAVLTLRVLPRPGAYRIVPYIFVADLSRDEFSSVTQLLDRTFRLKFRGSLLSDPAMNQRVRCELCAMMLNHLLLESIITGAGLSRDCFTFDSEKIIRSFGGDKPARNFIRAFLRNAPKLADSCIREFLSLPFLESFPFPVPSLSDRVLDLDETQELLEQRVYTRSVNAERVAYHTINGGLSRSMIQNGKRSVCMFLLLKNLSKMLQGTGKQLDIRKVFTCLLYLMDCGYTATIVRDLYDGEYYCHCMRVGEVSLSLMPVKYHSFIPLLMEMERYCLWGWKDMEWKIREYVGDTLGEPALAGQLWALTESIHRSGQRFLDWAEPAGPDDEAIRAYRDWKHLS